MRQSGSKKTVVKPGKRRFLAALLCGMAGLCLSAAVSLPLRVSATENSSGTGDAPTSGIVSFGTETGSCEKEFPLGSDTVFRGLYQTTDLPFTIEDYWDAEEASVFLEYRVSPLITDEVPATLTVLCNGVPVHSEEIRYDKGITKTLSVSIPQDILRSGYNAVSVTGYARIYDEEGCLDDFSGANWICLLKDSAVRVHYQIRDFRGSLQYYPYPVLSAEDPEGSLLGIYVPEEASDEEWRAALLVRAQLGAKTGEADRIRLGTFASDDGSRSNRIIVAQEERLPKGLRDSVRTLCGIRTDPGAFICNLSGNGAGQQGEGDVSETTLVVTAEDEEDLIEAAAMLLDPDRISQVRGSSVFVPRGAMNRGERETGEIAGATSGEKTSGSETAHSMLAGADGDRIYSLEDLTGTDGLQFTGPFRQEQTIFLPVSGGFVLGEGAALELSMRYSDNLDFERSMVTVYWGEIPVASKKLSREYAGGDELSFLFPADVLGTWSGSLKIAFDLEIEELYCTKRADEMPWAFVSGSSSIYLPLGQDGRVTLDKRPWPFQQQGVFTNVSAVLPGVMSEEEADLMGRVVALEAAGLTDAGSFHVYRAKEFLAAEDAADSHIITVGTYRDNALLQSLNGQLSFRYTQDGTAFESNEQVILAEGYAKEIGVIQLIRSPYADERVVLAAATADNDGIRRLSSFLEKQENTWLLSGDAVLVDADLNARSYTFLPLKVQEKVSLRDTIAQNREAVRFTLISTLAMLVLAAALIIALVRYRGSGK